MSVQRGQPVSWSIPATTITGTGLVAASHIIQSYDYTMEGEEKKIRGTDGKVANRTFYSDLEKLVLEIIPTSDTRAHALTVSILPARGADVTISGGADTDVTGSGTTDGVSAWMFITGNKKGAVDSEVRLTFNLERDEAYLVTLA